MELDKLIYRIEAKVKFDISDLEQLTTLSNDHYDKQCRKVVWEIVREAILKLWFEEPGVDTTNLNLTRDQLDTLCKITEIEGLYPHANRKLGAIFRMIMDRMQQASDRLNHVTRNSGVVHSE